MDAFLFWKRLDNSNPYPTLKRLTDECGIDYRRVKKNRSDNRLPNLEDAYLFSSTMNVQLEYLLTGKNASTQADEVYAFMQTEMPSLLEDIERKLRFKKGDGSLPSTAG